MFSKLNIKMQSMILLVLVPALLLVTVAVGFHVYNALYDVIIEGFDGKLKAVSTVTAAFIDGDTHRNILLPRHALILLLLGVSAIPAIVSYRRRERMAARPAA